MIVIVGFPQEGQLLNITIPLKITAKNVFQKLQIVVDNGCGFQTEIKREIIRGNIVNLKTAYN